MYCSLKVLLLKLLQPTTTAAYKHTTTSPAEPEEGNATAANKVMCDGAPSPAAAAVLDEWWAAAAALLVPLCRGPFRSCGFLRSASPERPYSDPLPSLSSFSPTPCPLPLWKLPAALTSALPSIAAYLLRTTDALLFPSTAAVLLPPATRVSTSIAFLLTTFPYLIRADLVNSVHLCCRAYYLTMLNGQRQDLYHAYHNACYRKYYLSHLGTIRELSCLLTLCAARMHFILQRCTLACIIQQQPVQAKSCHKSNTAYLHLSWLLALSSLPWNAIH
jgi:hypothetical protein